MRLHLGPPQRTTPVAVTKNKRVPLRAVKTFKRKGMGQTVSKSNFSRHYRSHDVYCS